MFERLQYISIIIELAIAVISIFLAVKNKKNYGWLLFTTFAIYVFYDFVKLRGISIGNFLYVLFFVSSLCALIAIIQIYKETSRRKNAK